MNSVRLELGLPTWHGHRLAGGASAAEYCTAAEFEVRTRDGASACGHQVLKSTRHPTPARAHTRCLRPLPASIGRNRSRSPSSNRTRRNSCTPVRRRSRGGRTRNPHRAGATESPPRERRPRGDEAPRPPIASSVAPCSPSTGLDRVRARRSRDHRAVDADRPRTGDVAEWRTIQASTLTRSRAPRPATVSPMRSSMGSACGSSGQAHSTGRSGAGFIHRRR